VAGALAAGMPAVAAQSAGAGDRLPQVLVSRQLAAEQKLTPGSTVTLARDETGGEARVFEVAGLYEPVPDPSELGSVPREVRLHLPDLLTFTREPGSIEGTEHIESVNVSLTAADDAATFARDVNAQLPGVAAQPATGASGQAGPFVVLERFHLAIAVVTIAASTVFLLALTIMLVDERRETVGVLRLIGLPVRRILSQVLLEGVLVAGAGGVFGLVLARLSEIGINAFFQWRYDTALVFVRLTPQVAALSVAIAVPLGAVATVVASWALLRTNALRLARR
jgi:putative ABC transport system permease protein